MAADEKALIRQGWVTAHTENRKVYVQCATPSDAKRARMAFYAAGAKAKRNPLGDPQLFAAAESCQISIEDGSKVVIQPRLMTGLMQSIAASFQEQGIIPQGDVKEALETVEISDSEKRMLERMRGEGLVQEAVLPKESPLISPGETSPEAQVLSKEYKDNPYYPRRG